MQWKIGNVDIFHIVELEDAGKPIQDGIKQATSENLQQISWLSPHFIDEKGIFKSYVASFLIKSEKNILVDTCNGNDKTRTDLPEWGSLHTDFLNKLNETGVKETDIDIVINTHLHCDHVGWNTKMVNGQWVPTFPNAAYLFAEEEYSYWKQKPEKEVADDKDAFADSVQPIIDAGLYKIVPSNYEIDKYVSLVFTPGHTPGHVSIMIESDNNKAFISGDLLHHPCQILHPEWSSDYDGLPEVAIETRRKTYHDLTDTNTLFFGSHFAGPVAGYIKKENNNFIFQYE